MSIKLAFSRPDAFFERFERKDGDTSTTHYCPGCGHGLVHKYIAEAIDDLGVQDRTILINPVGCSVFAYYYFDFGHVQVPHGRAPAAATAVKRAHPDALVLSYQGDGDLAAIGTAEIIHAANRGENLTMFFINNAIYGMTGGQMAPTSMVNMKTTTTPRGRSPLNEGFPLRVCELLATLEAPYFLQRVAVGEARHNAKARRAIRHAIQNQLDNRGFSLVEILSPCPTGWKMAPTDAVRWTIDEMVRTFPLGVFRDGHELDLGHPRRRSVVAPEEIPALLGIANGSTELSLPDHGHGIEDARVKVAGFGGQGVLSLGLVLAHAGMLARRHVAWMPSYGPEMRGGTAHCHVTLSDREVGSPLIESPTLLLAMNGPSLERFGASVVPGGTIIYNASLIQDRAAFAGVKTLGVPAQELAATLGESRAANLVMLGALAAHSTMLSAEAILAAVPRVLTGDPTMQEVNRQAFELGRRTVAAAVTV
jgi:2-oxoisovalerate ferredoxin oxidoreductase beta subunit